MNEPKEELVGNIIDLKCGHTQRPSDLESVMFTVHLEAAGFVKGKGPIGSPNRAILNSVKSVKSSASSSAPKKSYSLIQVKTPMPERGAGQAINE